MPAVLIVDIGVLGLDFQRFIVLSDGFVQLSFLEERTTQISPDICVVRFNLKRFSEMNDCCVQLALLKQDAAEVVVGHPKPWDFFLNSGLPESFDVGSTWHSGAR